MDTQAYTEKVVDYIKQLVEKKLVDVRKNKLGTFLLDANGFAATVTPNEIIYRFTSDGLEKTVTGIQVIPNLYNFLEDYRIKQLVDKKQENDFALFEELLEKAGKNKENEIDEIKGPENKRKTNYINGSENVNANQNEHPHAKHT